MRSIVPIQSVIDIKQAELDAINSELASISGELALKNSQIADKQIVIELKVEEKEALPEGDPLRVPIQEAINLLVDERDLLTDELSPLLAQEQLKMDESIAKLTELNAEVSLKEILLEEQSYLVKEKARLLDKKRKIQWRARFNAIPDLRMAMEKAGLQQPNAKVFVRDILNSGDETNLLAIEAVASQVQEDLDAVEARKQKLIDAKAVIKAVDPLTITQGDAVRLLKNVIILLQGM